MHTFILWTHAMNTHIHSLDTHERYTRSFCGFHNSHMNAACCMDQITSEWVILNIKASCYLWMSRVTSETSCDL